MSSNGTFTSNGPLPAVSATGTTDNADGIDASSVSGTGVSGSSTEGVGVTAFSKDATALIANNENASPAAFIGTIAGIGLWAIGEGVPDDPIPNVAAAIVAQGSAGAAVSASTTGGGIAVSAADETNGTGGTAVSASTIAGTAVLAQAGLEQTTGPYGLALHATGPTTVPSSPPDSIVPTVFVEGASVEGTSNVGVYVEAQSGTAVFAQSGTGNAPHPPPGIGVHAVGAGASPTNSVSQAAIVAEGGSGNGVVALTTNGTAISASDGAKGNGVLAGTNGGIAVNATDNGSGVAVNAISDGGTGVAGNTGTGVGVSAQATDANGIALQVIGKVEVQGNSVGSVTMAAGTKTLTVTNAAATPNSLIFLTPLENPHAFLWIGERNAGKFTIDASTALPAKVTIGFLIIN